VDAGHKEGRGIMGSGEWGEERGETGYSDAREG
jgi:hypothetical protein